MDVAGGIKIITHTRKRRHKDVAQQETPMHKNEARTGPLGPAPIPETVSNLNLLRAHYRTVWIVSEGLEAVRAVNRAFRTHMKLRITDPKEWREFHYRKASEIERRFLSHIWNLDE